MWKHKFKVSGKDSQDNIVNYWIIEFDILDVIERSRRALHIEPYDIQDMGQVPKQIECGKIIYNYE